MSRDLVGVAIVTEGTVPWRLQHAVDSWCALGVEVVVAAPDDVLRRLQLPARVVCVEADPLPEHGAFARRHALEAIRRPWALVTSDHIVPVAHTWLREGALSGIQPDTIQALELRTELGQRAADWARYDGRRTWNQAYDTYGSGTYIRGDAQLLSPQARLVAWSNGDRRRRDGDDIRFAWDAVMAGIRLRPPAPDAPLLLELDRLPPHTADPDRLGVPLSDGPGAEDVVQLADLVFRVRPGTWDPGILAEVIAQDTYDANLWAPVRPNPVIVDVGAHIGAFSAWLGSAFPDGRILAFEAMGDNAALARLNTVAMPNVRVHQIAVAGQDGRARARRVVGPNTGGHSVADDPGGEIETRGILGLLEDHDVDMIDFLKLDCEGAEWPILQALSEAGQLGRIRHLAMELHFEHEPGRALEPMLALLRSRFSHVVAFPTASPDLWRVMAR